MASGPPVIEASRVVVSVPAAFARRPGRRRAVLALAGVPLLALLAAETGALVAVHNARAQAQALAQEGDYARAVALYRTVAARGGPLYLLAGSQIGGAPADAARALLAWGDRLAAQGHIDQALEADREAEETASVAGDAARRYAVTVLQDARRQAGRGRYDVALDRLDQLAASSPPADLATQGELLRPGYALGAGRELLDQGQGAAAVAALDQVVRQAGNRPEAAQARALLPAALLEAGRQAADVDLQGDATSYLQRLITDAPTSAEAAEARRLLAAPQPVTGTVVRGGHPITNLQVRLGSHYREQGSGYSSSGPYYDATTDANGNFEIAGVPLGGPYVLEILEPGGWTTVVGADGKPSYQVTVAPLTPVDLVFIVLPG